MTLFIAGHETTANALAWALYLLAKNPTWLAKAQSELRAATGSNAVTATDYPKLNVLQNIFSETLRLYPPAWTISREAIADTTVGGYTVKSGTTVVLSQWVMHRHPRYWNNPTEFNPDRFANAASSHDGRSPSGSRPKFAYFPFGGGARQCIGDQFASIEGVLILAVLLKHFEPGLISPEYTAEIHPMITLRPKGGMPLLLKPLPA
jgi:cytochrome P450